MAVFLDGIPAIPEKESDDATFQMCYETLFAFSYNKKRAIEKAKIDGKMVGIGDFPKYYDVYLKDIATLEFFTINKDDLTERMSYIGKKLIEESKNLEQISALVNAGHDEDALMIVRNVSVMTHDLLLYHRYFAIFGLPIQYPIGDSNMIEYKDKINSLLRQILDAIDAKDTVEFSDLAEYELAPIIKELGENLQDLSL